MAPSAPAGRKQEEVEPPADGQKPFDDRLLAALGAYGADPSSEAGLCDLALAYLALGRGEDAFVVCSSAQVRTARISITEAEVFAAQGFNSDASSILQRVLGGKPDGDQSPETLEATLLLGRVRLGMRRFQQAFNTYRRLLEQDPGCAAAQDGVMDVLQKQAAAKSDAEYAKSKAAKQSAGFPGYDDLSFVSSLDLGAAQCNHLAKTYESLGQWADVASLDNMVSSPEARIAVVHACCELDDVEHARSSSAELRRIVTQCEGPQEVQAEAAKVLCKLSAKGKSARAKDEALKYFEITLQRSPPNLDHHAELVKIFQSGGAETLAPAIQRYKRFVESDPETLRLVKETEALLKKDQVAPADLPPVTASAMVAFVGSPFIVFYILYRVLFDTSGKPIANVVVDVASDKYLVCFMVFVAMSVMFPGPIVPEPDKDKKNK